MPDREKAIRILEGNYKSFVLRHNGELLTVNELIALLKAQENEIEELKQEIEGHKDNLRETLDEMMRYADELKAQEPKPVHVTAEINHRKIGECPNCGKPINSGDYPNYCGSCGQAVKWK